MRPRTVSQRPLLRTAVLWLWVGFSGCYDGVGAHTGGGGTDDSGGTGSEGDEPNALDDAGDTDDGAARLDACYVLGRQELRMLSSTQFETALRELLPPSLVSEALSRSAFPPTVIEANFSTFGAANRVNSDDARRIEDTAEAIADVLIEDFASHAATISECLDAGIEAETIDGCIDPFIEAFGARAFRRPLLAQERDLVRGIYDELRATQSAEVAFASVVQFFVQAPGFLYLVEPGVEAASGGLTPLTDHEVAARLGILFLDGLPDAELTAAADEGRLSTRQDVEREARRLAALPTVSRPIEAFHHEWVFGYRLETDAREHPALDDAATSALRVELREFARWFMTQTDGRFSTLMTSPEYSPDAALAKVYEGEDARPTIRSGLLTTAAAMAAQAHPNETSLVERGLFLRRHVLCLPTGEVPADVDEAELEDASDEPTARQRLEPLLTNPSCSGCHASFNPLGFPLEEYDWAGAHRTTEQGAVIDLEADLGPILGPDFGVVSSGRELVERLAETDQAQACYARHWFRYAMGRMENEEGLDDCALEQIVEAFVASDGDVRELLVAIAVSDAFRFRTRGEQ